MQYCTVSTRFKLFLPPLASLFFSPHALFFSRFFFPPLPFYPPMSPSHFLFLPPFPSFLPPSLPSLSRLELLSTIQEIRGPLRIQGWRRQMFPYLRNLRRIGHPNGTTLSLNCSGQSEFSALAIKKIFKIWVSAFSRRKQSADDQAQLDVGGEATNNLRAKRAAKFLT